ncbi:hypothetical protein [Amycolatopsis samaneae]|uniref:Esterase-like activity of phytase n=1 Tax=Amycolatopsis samaneae TaxID=664691 RepID=A0ABW5GEQ8_9PSEU
MRTVVTTAVTVLLLGTALTGPAAAEPPPAPETLCTVTDPRVDELSGLVSDGERWYGVNDGGERVEVFVLGRDCAVREVRTEATDPYDVEDLARAADGTLWLADTGDNRGVRTTVALHALSPRGTVTLHRLTYPDGPHDAEALLLDRSGTPYVITKDVLGASKVYRPTGPLASPGPTPLEKVGSLEVKSTDTPGGPVGAFGSALITGAASTVDGTVIALRTYTDAYLYAAPDGDVAAALRHAPVRIPLPGEKQGEALAFEPDGTLLSGGEGIGQPIRAVRGAAALAARGAAAAPAAGTTGSPGGEASGAGLPVLPAAGIAVVIVLAGWLGVSGLRRRRR